MEACGGSAAFYRLPPYEKKRETLSCEIATGLDTSEQFVTELKGDGRCYFTAYWTTDSRYRYRHS